MASSNESARSANRSTSWRRTARLARNSLVGAARATAYAASVLGGMLGALVFAAIAILVGGAVLVHTGWYNVAATEGQTRVGSLGFEYVLYRSVRAHARDIVAPPLEAHRAHRGAALYREACEICHRAPGGTRSPVALALQPAPADLPAAARRWQPRELFWIVKHGIRMSGMPAWGDVYTDSEIWDIVSLVARLPAMSPEEYEELQKHEPASRERSPGGES